MHWTKLKRSRSIVVLVGALLISSYITAAQEGGPASALPEDVLFVANGIEQARAKLGQATGRATFVRRSKVEETNLIFDFYLDEDKVRWDTHVVGDQMLDGTKVTRPLLTREAYDGKAGFSAIYMDGKEINYAYVHAQEDMSPVRDARAYTGYYAGIAFSPRGLYIPEELSNISPLAASLERLVEKGAIIEVEGDVTRDRTVVLSIGMGDYVIELQVDVANGFVITREEHYLNEELFSTRLREYERDANTGAMLLTRYLQPSSPKSDVYHEITINYASVGEAIPAQTFTLHGFDLPPGVTVYDLARDVKYKLFPIDENDLEEIAEGLLVEEPEVAVTEEEKPMLSAEAGPQVAVAQTAPPSSNRTICIVIVVAALVLLLAVVFLILRRKAGIQKKSG